jgi:hypothetical protein
MANHQRRDRFTDKLGKHFADIDNELQMLVDNHNQHDSGLKGWTALNIKDGSNKRMGVATLVGGTVTVANTTVTASSRIFTSRQATGGTLGHLSIGTVVASTSFVINSSSATDTSVVAWLLIEPK